ncbi:MAG: hypothetical protein QOK42_2699 [Frankiaceae bacterium]|jgi:hypothetical protein|nr:hypothetical protein [Frankiaceae bacterium]MDX6226026.1 hypothetical protein [Frankiales bacterium]MDX6274937.1 hypothetical protein [Frankiales bacterium]
MTMQTGTPLGTTNTGATTDYPSVTHHQGVRRVSDETKPAWKTTEFIAYVACVIGVLIASAVVGTNTNTGANNAEVGDYFRADRAWMLITILTVGYMASRGLAKAGSRDSHDERYGNNR